MYEGRGIKISSTRRKNNSYVVSAETREKIRQHNLKTGKIPPSRKGAVTPEGVRRKISYSLKLSGHCPPNLTGLKRSEGFKNKISKNNARYWLGKKGKQAAHYIDGRTTENQKIRGTVEIKLWRKACMERDDFTCQKTKIRGGRLVVHHINNFADFSELRTSISNGITLSFDSHKEFHKKYGRRNNTREQLLEFLSK
jgi:hypothetical protein